MAQQEQQHSHDDKSSEWVQQQMNKMVVSFDQADTDKSGFLSLCEVLAVLNGNGFNGNMEDAKALFCQLDENHDHKVSNEEFNTVIYKLPRISIKEYVLRKAFKSLDKDDSGALTRAEIEKANQNECGIAIAQEQVDKLLSTLKKDKPEDVVDYEEFLTTLGMEETATVMYNVFEKLDRDSNGYLSQEEIMHALDEEPELKIRAGKISDLLVAWCKDKDHKLDYKEFVQAWIQHK